jgi:hypothetical protein
VTIKGEGDGSSGGFSISTVKVSVPTVLAALGVSAEGSSGVSGELKFDLKARIEPGGALNIAGPLTIINGGWDHDGLSVRELTGEIKLEYAEAAKIDLRGLNFQVNEEPLVMSGIMKKVGEELRCEQCLIKGVGGQAVFDGAVSLVTPGRFEFTGRGQDLNIERLRRMFSVDPAGDALTGELTDLRWRFSGNRGEEFSRSLEGGLAFRLERGALHGVNIARVAIERVGTIPLLRDALLESIPPQFQGALDDTDTPIRRLIGDVSVREGRASTEELRLESDLFALGARGEYKFDGAVNLGATLWLEREFAYALADRVVELRSLFGREGTIVVPLRVSGAPTELTVTPDIGALLERAAQRAIERGAERFIGEAIDRLGGRESREP